MNLTPRRFVYVFESLANPARHYLGLTSKVAARLALHNDGHVTHTVTNRPWRLLVSIEFVNSQPLLRSSGT